MSTVSLSEATDEFRDAETRLLLSDSFSRTASAEILSSQTAEDVSPCDSYAQRALLLVEMPLVEAALRAGATVEFDQRVRSLEDRSRKILSCTPRQSFVWLLMFDLALLHGELNEQSFKLLEISYETSPNEAWISVRRIIMVMPYILLASDPLQQKILVEFQQLIKDGFVADAARAYLKASASIRELLQSRVDQLDLVQQRQFSEAISNRRS